MATKIKNWVTDFLDRNFYYKGRGANNGQWDSFEDEDNKGYFLELAKPHSWKTLAHIRVRYYTQEYEQYKDCGHEITIEMYLNSYCTFDTVFEGWVENIEELKTIFKCLGIDYYEEENGREDKEVA